MREVKKSIHYWCREIREEHLTGRGVTAAVLDTGTMPHPDLAGRIAGWKDCVAGRTRLYDDNGHGTHVAGILAGDGRCSRGAYAGMAPGARLVPVKVLDKKGGGRIESVIRGIRYVLEERNRLGIRIVNISIGTMPHGEDPDEEALLFWVEKLWDAGLTVVAAAGNLGPEAGTITLPGVSPKVITVGSCDEMLPGQTAGLGTRLYSGCGPTRDCIKKPDLTAPGSHIYSCRHTYPAKSHVPYLPKSGTSMSTPVVAGAVALLLEKYPEMTNLEIKLRLWASCEDLGLPGARQGHGRLDLARFLAL